MANTLTLLECITLLLCVVSFAGQANGQTDTNGWTETNRWTDGQTYAQPYFVKLFSIEPNYIYSVYELTGTYPICYNSTDFTFPVAYHFV